MPTAPLPDPDGQALATIRARAARVTAELLERKAPADPLERLAFVAGAGSVDLVQEAVDRCRAAGWTWPQIAVALDQNVNTTKTKYGSGYEAQRRYRARKRDEG